ncbi:transcriptional regulator [Bifidobacterium lemurum]|uniref:Transcriptional regulator n=1 Tax=Bifidobacterium lemurum TaxID=1603886 RepID=A0A261FNL4_9BIFI|nr:transcriptional regulator [Bifidobacterium lemurum]OZG60575.1 transcriptional regulator [Bifidobacterium lemurum]QOL34212.1 transcriptional regulator [Bifidobacterium lemurum]
MSDNSTDRKALEALAGESPQEQIAYYRKPFMVLWAAVQEASSELSEDYDLSPEMAQLWVAERMRQVSDSLVDRLAEKAASRGISKSNIARAADASPANALRRFPRLRNDADAAKTRLLIDDVLDSLE